MSISDFWERAKKALRSLIETDVGESTARFLENVQPCRSCGKQPMLTDLGSPRSGLHLTCVNARCPSPMFTNPARLGRTEMEAIREWHEVNADTPRSLLEAQSSRSRFSRSSIQNAKQQAKDSSLGGHQNKLRSRRE